MTAAEEYALDALYATGPHPSVIGYRVICGGREVGGIEPYKRGWLAFVGSHGANDRYAVAMNDVVPIYPTRHDAAIAVRRAVLQDRHDGDGKELVPRPARR